MKRSASPHGFQGRVWAPSRFGRSWKWRGCRKVSGCSVCRNIKMLFNFDPPATDEEIHAAALQFVRKLSGFNKPSKANEAVFNRAVEEVAAVARSLLDSLVTSAEPRDREAEAERARASAAERFGT